MTVTPEAHIRAHLLASPAFSALTTAIEPSASSEKTPLPRVVYTRISRDGRHHMGGASGLVYLLIQFDIFANLKDQAEAIGEAIRNRMDGFRGVIVTNDEARRFHVVTVAGERDETIPPTDGSDLVTFRRMVDLFVSCNEPLPQLTA